MTAFAQLTESDAAEATPPPPVKRPSRWALVNWPVRWKVLAIVLVPLLLAGVFGGLRISSSVTAASELRLAADRAELIPSIAGYMSALEAAMVTGTEGGDTESAVAEFDASKSALQQRLSATDVVPDVRLAVTTLLTYGQDLVDRVMANAIELRSRVTTYTPLLLTAQSAIVGSLQSDDEQVRLQAEALAAGVAAHGQMAMQRMLVNRGGELPDPELRAAMITLASTEPSAVSGMSRLLGGASEQAAALRSQMVRRLAIMSDPASVLAGNPDLLGSQQATEQIAAQVIGDTASAIPTAVAERADAQRGAAIRDAVLVLAAIVVALAVVTLVARSLVRPLRTLRDSALKVAHDDLAQEIERVRSGNDPGTVEPIPVHTTEEVGQVAHAVDELHQQAVLLAGEQARLQLQVGDMFETLSRRSRSLVDQQLSLIDRLERNEEDPDRLQSLFRLDHLAARMRRNGANLLVLAGAKVPREQAEPVAVSEIVNAAASEVEDYARVITATVPDSAIVGAAAGDVVHLLAELLDNALRYSPPVSQVRVSAVHTGQGGLVIEVGDLGLGMTDSDLRVANTRLQSGGEVTPYTARHMGLFVVGRLAAQHGLVVRLRSTIAGEPSSGTTAGLYLPAELITGASGTAPADADPGFGTAAAPGDGRDAAAPAGYQPSHNGHSELPAGLLPQRNPGASGISDHPGVPAELPQRVPSDTSAYFASRPDAPAQPERQSTAGDGDAIYQSMVSEWLIDPTEIARSSDLNWEFVWDHGWSAAAAAESAPVEQHTEAGLPMRQPGARLVPGGVDAAAADRGRNGGSRVPSAAAPIPRRDPDAVRASIGSHFGGVQAGRTHARHTKGTDRE